MKDYNNPVDEYLLRKAKEDIDKLSHYDMCYQWRFYTSEQFVKSYPGELGEYFAKRLKDLGGFTPEISKRLGW